MNDVLRGCLFSLCGNIAISIGDHLKVFGDQKNETSKKLYHHSSHHKNDKRKHHKYSRLNLRFLFGLLGYIVMITGQICNGYALAFAPQTLLACIGSIQFIMNLICSAILMSRPIKGIHIIGTFSIIIGCLVMIFGFSPKTDQSQLTVYTLFYNFNSLHYRNYLIIVVFVFLLSIIWQYFETNYLNFNNSLNTTMTNNQFSPKTTKNKKRRNATPRTDKNIASFNNNNTFCCIDTKLISGFFYSFSSAMTGTQSVVLGKTLAIIIRNYAAGKIVIFNPLDLFILFFILIIFLSFLITFAFWLYRRTESMVLFDTVFIAPMNQVMWLTFSTVAGGIYFHEFENAHTFQWIALIAGMMFNYFGLYYLVPTAADQPILIINMEKPPKKKVDDDEKISTDDISHSEKDHESMTIHNNNSNNRNKRKHIQQIDVEQNDIKKNIIIKSTKPIYHKSVYHDDYFIENDKEHETEDENEYSLKGINLAPTDDEEEEDSESIGSIQSTNSSTLHSISIHDTIDSVQNIANLRISLNDIENEQEPLLSHTHSNDTNDDKNDNNHKWYKFFVAKENI